MLDLPPLLQLLLLLASLPRTFSLLPEDGEEEEEDATEQAFSALGNGAVISGDEQ